MNMENLISESGDDGREYPSHPRIGVGALVQRNGTVLLVRRAREPALGKWSVPGGMMEVGETLAEAARREVREECGIEVDIGEVFDTAESIVRDAAGRVQYHYVIIDFYAAFTGGDVCSGSDAEECCWVPLEELAGYDLTDSLEEAFRRHGFIKGGK